MEFDKFFGTFVPLPTISDTFCKLRIKQIFNSRTVRKIIYCCLTKIHDGVAVLKLITINVIETPWKLSIVMLEEIRNRLIGTRMHNNC